MVCPCADRGASRCPRTAFLLLGVGLTLCVLGCSDSQVVSQRIKEQLAESKGNIVAVAKFAGKVTIDGEPPALPPRYVLVVILFDAKGKEAGHETIYQTICDKEGHFEFTRYSKGDGVPPGSYTVLFVELMHRLGDRFTGADELKNLYNDPDKSPFQVELSPPGKTDWEFNLEVAGKDPVVTPGPHALTRLRKR
jgi:hypothetical protein